ncbi:MAG: hypothetical protein Q9168_004116 [Polycauliona sp. 1 TL-2023]
MEALAVLGIVANIVQLVDAAGKAFSVCHEIYALGSTIEDIRMSLTSKQLLDAYDELLQDHLLNASKPQDPAGLLRQCEVIKTRAITRSAGLLEISIDSNYENTPNLQNTDKANGTDMRSPSIPSHDLRIYYHSKLKFLHRTARDFLTNTEDGQKLSGSPRDPREARSKNILRARMIALKQGFVPFYSDCVQDIMWDIKRHFQGHSDANHETRLVVALRRICQQLSIPDDPEKHIGYGAFWEYHYPNFECAAASSVFPNYIQDFVQERDSVTSYDRGLLALYAVSSRDRFVNFSAMITLVSWLALNGADLHRRHTDPRVDDFHERAPEHTTILTAPASAILRAIDDLTFKDTMVMESCYNDIRSMLPYLGSPSCLDIVRVSPEQGCRVLPHLAFKPVVLADPLYVEMSILKICYLMMDKVEQKVANGPRWR